MSNRQVLQRNMRSMSAPFYPPAPDPSVERKATTWQPIEETQVDRTKYPANLHLPLGPLTAPSQCQALLRLSSNFASETESEVLEMRLSGEVTWNTLDDDKLNDYLDARAASQLTQSPNKASIIFRVVFVYLTDVKKTEQKTSFGCKLSLRQKTAENLLKTFQVNPHFVQFLLGKPDHLAPFDTHDVVDGIHQQHEFICQYPRWFVHSKQEPCSVYFRHDTVSTESTYIVVSHREEEFVKRSKTRLRDLLLCHTADGVQSLSRIDPFYLSSIFCRESLADSEIITRQVRLSLYDILDVVDTYADKPFDRSSLRKSTKELHKISQDCERLLSNCEMLSMVIRSTKEAHSKMRATRTMDEITGGNSVQVVSTTYITDSLSYLTEAVEQQKRWLQGYRRRKDTGMNLVYNLVMQQDSETNTSIAIATKDDSAVMKVIALLTMLFLPLTAVTSFFGMSFFTTSENGNFTAAHKWWIFWTVAMPVTFMTVAVYYIWWQWEYLKGGWFWKYLKPSRKQGLDEESDKIC